MAERHSLPNKKRDRNLIQYRDMTDEEYDETFKNRVLGLVPSQELEKRIEARMEDFANDYDLDDLKINDTLTLRALIQSIISLEDLEQTMFELRSKGLDGNNVLMLDKLGREMSQLRGDISRFQDDLKITRKIRKSDQETSVLEYIEKLKLKARDYYQSKMMYILCPKCHILLGTIWLLYPDEKKNKIELTCNRILDDGSTCGEKIVVYPKDLIATRGSNEPNSLPESIL